MVISTRLRFILISVSITLLCLILFTAVLYDRAIDYKHQQEIRTNRILGDQFFQLTSGVDDFSDSNYSVIENIAIKTQPALLFAILDSQINLKYIFEKKELKLQIVREILPQLKANKNLHEGQFFDKNNQGYYWLIRAFPGAGKETNSLLIIYPLSSSVASEVMQFFGLPFFISGFLLLWVMVWASIILSSLVSKLQNQKQILSDQATDIEKARDEAVSANASKSNFLANMSHEIRIPLTSIIGFAESCSDTDCSIEERNQALKTIIRSGKHLMTLINEILDLSKIEAGKLEIQNTQVNLVELVEEINQFISVLAQEKGLTFGVNYIYPLPEKIIIDPLRLKQVLLNISANAIKFTQKGSVYLNISFDGHINSLTFEVIDTGIGMREEELKKIFKPFEQADTSITRKYGGTGLGLTLSKQLTEMLNGTLSVSSSVNKGSCFRISLRMKEVENNKYIEAKDIKPHNDVWDHEVFEPHQLQGKILVAEDNEDIRALVKLIIKKLGITPEIVENGELAVAKALESDFDLVLLDIQMPVMDGLTAVKELRKRGYHKPVVAMTANAMQKDRDECSVAGFDSFVCKPIDRKNLYDVISEFLKPVNTKEMNMLTSDLLIEDPDLIDLIDKFISRLPEMRKAILRAYEEKKWEEFSGLVHQMKGVGGGYGYPMLTELCAKIEVQLKYQNMENVAALIQGFNDMAEQILAGNDENHRIANQVF